MADYKIELGISLQSNALDGIKNDIRSLEKDPIEIKLNTTQAEKQIENLKQELKSLGGSKNKEVDLDLNTADAQKSLAEVAKAIISIKDSIGTLDSKKGMKSLVGSINQITESLKGASAQFEGLNRSLEALSKKDFGFNFNLKTGNTNPLKAATDYGQEASRKAIPAIKEQINYLKNAINVTTDADKALEKYLFKQHKGHSGIALKRSLEKQVLSGYDLDGNKVSKSDRMIAGEELVGYYKEIAALNNINLDGFNAKFSKSATEIVDDTTKIQTGVKQTEEAVESAVNEIKQLFGGGIGAEQLSAEIKPIVDDLHSIQQAITALSKDTSLGGLTASFNRLSEAIENLLANAERVKGVLNSGFDVGNVGNASTSIDTSAIDKIEKASDDATAAVVQNEKKKQEAYKATTDAVVYHAGVVSKLNKAETNGRFYGSNRGTGYFGTGHYFVDSATKHELDNNGYYNKLPYTSVDISQYDNLFKATTDEVADRLHTFLANLTSFTQGSDNYDISELFAQFKSVFGDTIMDVKEFGSRLDQLKAFMSNSSLDDRSDSVSTQFMKSLGYEGVDTRGTRFADTRYGTVIYDLKEESILQANITDELQKQGQMLEKINYAKGQAFDKGEDERIQGILDQQAKKREIAEEFQNSFDTTNLKNVDADLTSAKNRLKEIDEIIYDVQYGMDNAEQEVRKFAKEMSDFGLDMSEDEIKEEIQRRTKNYGEAIDELSQEKAELQSKIPILEEVYNKEAQLANEAYLQAQQVVEQRRLEEQQARQTADAVDQLANAHQNAAKVNTTSGVDDDFKAIGIQVEATEDQIGNLQTALQNFGFSGSAIQSITDDISKVGFEVKEITHQLNNDGSVKITVKGVDDLNQAVTAIKSVRMVDDEPNISTTTKITQKLDHTVESFKKLKSLAKEMGDLDIKIAGLEADGKIDEANSLRRVLDGLKSDYQELYLVTEKNLGTDQIKELDQIFANTSGEVREFKQELAEAVKTQELTSGLERLKSIAQEINGLKIELFKAEDTGNIERITNRLNELENESSELRAELQQKFPTASFDQIDDIARKGEEAVAQLVNKVAEAKAKLAQGIKVDMELGNFDNEISGMYEKFNKLSGASVELRNAVEQVENAYREMELALQGTGDEVADRERLIKAEREYAAALEKTNNLIRIQAREDKAANDRFKLDDDIKLFQADIDRWLATNSAATKRFGSTMLDLKAKAEGVDRVTLNGLIRQFKLADKEAEKFGLKGLSVVDKLKTKFKEYSTYLSAAEVFMYAEQAFRSMFEQVKLIDSAMTELKKVTDETDASYNQFLSRAASRSKELGTTIDGLVSSTADFARLGYSFEDSQGLAEVANIYAVVGDEIDGVEGATESLVSTLAAFKDELSGISDTDFAMDIIDKFNEVSNNFSISSGGIGEAMQRSASSLRAANNTIDESIALITAANSVVQDPTVVGTAFKTISMRIRGAKTELEEAGLETEGMVESTATLRAEIEALTGVDIMKNANEFKSTYQIMDELAAKWQDLTDIQQAKCLPDNTEMY